MVVPPPITTTQQQQQMLMMKKKYRRSRMVKGLGILAGTRSKGWIQQHTKTGGRKEDTDERICSIGVENSQA
jgi:hypothetical protein